MKTMSRHSIYKNENRFLHLVIFKISLLKVDIFERKWQILLYRVKIVKIVEEIIGIYYGIYQLL